MRSKICKTKEGLRRSFFYSHLYRFTIDLVWDGYGKQLADYIKRVYEVDIDVREVDGRCVEIMNGDYGCAHVIYLRSFRKTSRCHAILAHECFHATEQILAQRGVDFLKDGSNEPYAYLHEYIFERCLDALNQKQK